MASLAVRWVDGKDGHLKSRSLCDYELDMYARERCIASIRYLTV